MDYFVTGATGFIGRFLIAQLLQRADSTVYALVRPGSEARLHQIAIDLQVDDSRLIPIPGNLTQPGLGITDKDLAMLQGKIQHVFHLAAIYDLTADAISQQRANVDGTRHAIEAATALQAGCFHHVSSIAVAGLYPGRFDESMFEQATGLNDHYFRTKHEAEKCVRAECHIPHRIYRPSMVVGHSQTGAMDKVDGIYYTFKIMQRLNKMLPKWLPLIGIEGGQFNIVPVDYVVQAMDVIAHTPALDGQCFHLTADRHYNLGELLNLVAREANAPLFKYRISNRVLQRGPLQLFAQLGKLAPLKALMDSILARMNLPPSTLSFVTYPTTYDRSKTVVALSNTGIQPPLLEQYLPALWQYWSEHLDPERDSRTCAQ